MKQSTHYVILGVVAVFMLVIGIIIGGNWAQDHYEEEIAKIEKQKVETVIQEVVVVEEDKEMACVFAYLSKTMAEALLEEWGHYDELVEAKSLAITYQIGNDCESYIDGL